MNGCELAQNPILEQALVTQTRQEIKHRQEKQESVQTTYRNHT